MNATRLRLLACALYVVAVPTFAVGLNAWISGHVQAREIAHRGESLKAAESDFAAVLAAQAELPEPRTDRPKLETPQGDWAEMFPMLAFQSITVEVNQARPGEKFKPLPPAEITIFHGLTLRRNVLKNNGMPRVYVAGTYIGHGIVLAPAQRVADAYQDEVRVIFHRSGNFKGAHIVGIDPTTGLAVIQAYPDGKGPVALPVREDRPAPGERLMALDDPVQQVADESGPFSFVGMAAGIVTGYGQEEGQTWQMLMRSDMATVPNFDGSPVVDAHMQLVGIISATGPTTRILPINTALTAARRVLLGEHRQLACLPAGLAKRG